MYIYKEGYSLIDLSHIYRVIPTETDDKISIRFDYSSDTWSKYHFESKEDRDEYLAALAVELKAINIELNGLDKLMK